jgi:segregation and condensation protein A
MTEAAYQVRLDVFEGPLDLLLHLVKKHELNILDIPISFVTEKYLSYLDAMAALDIDVAGEYLVMAATLCHLKSRELLPTPDELEDEEVEVGEDGEELDPRADLIRRLLEYQKYKDAASALGDRPVVGRNVWGRGTAMEDAIAENVDADAIAPLAQFPVHKLIEAFDRLLARAKIRVSHDVIVERLSVGQRIAELADRLEREGRFAFTSMFRFLEVPMTAAQVRNEAVVTFLALLEMAKLRLIGLAQHDGDDEIWIHRVADDLQSQLAHKIAASGVDADAEYT